MIDEHFLKVMSSISPILLEVHGKVACNHHSASVGHEASLVHLTNQCIDQRHTSLSLSPSVNCIFAGLPIVVLSFVDSIGRKCLIFVSHVPKFVEVAPKKLIDENLGRLVSGMFFFIFLSSKVNFSDRNRSIGEPWAQFRRIFRANQIIPGVIIMFDRFSFVDVLTDSFQTVLLATNKFVACSFVRLNYFLISEPEFLQAR